MYLSIISTNDNIVDYYNSLSMCPRTNPYSYGTHTWIGLQIAMHRWRILPLKLDYVNSITPSRPAPSITARSRIDQRRSSPYFLIVRPAGHSLSDVDTEYREIRSHCIAPNRGPYHWGDSMEYVTAVPDLASSDTACLLTRKDRSIPFPFAGDSTARA